MIGAVAVVSSHGGEPPHIYLEWCGTRSYQEIIDYLNQDDHVQKANTM